MALALYTFGLFSARADEPANDGFRALSDSIMALVDRADGLIARSGYATDPGPESWGVVIYPRFYREKGDGWSPATLSLWVSVEAVFSFTYSGLHAAALKRGREWFETPQWPPLAMWWHEGRDYPTWAEGVRRHEYLHDNGPSPVAFTFKQMFDEAGAVTKLDKGRLGQFRQAGG